MTEKGKRMHFAEMTKQSKNEIQGNDKTSHTYSHSFFNDKINTFIFYLQRLCLHFHLKGDMPSNRIGFGKPVKDGELPYQVFLIMGATCGPSGFILECGGTLISDRHENQWIVTAAHCINGASSSLPRDHSNFNLRVRAGSIDNTCTKHERRIPLDSKHIIFHPDWEGSNNYSSCKEICDMRNDICSECTECRSTTFSGMI